MATVGIVGAGLMGHGIAVALARGGHDVNVYDPDQRTMETLPDRVTRALAHCGVTEPDGREVRARIRPAHRLPDALDNVEIVVEATPERLETKHQVLESVEDAIPSSVPVWTNTSVLSVTSIAATMRHPERLVGVHWWNPAYLVPLVELAPGEKTDERHLDEAEEMVGALGKTVVRLHQDIPGFIGNRLQFALVREAFHLLEQGACAPETIDTVVRNGFGLRLAAVGPMENADYIGLDLTRSILAHLAPSLGTAKEPSHFLDTLLSKGRRGAAAGQGLLPWPPGRRAEVARRLDEGIRRNLPAH